MNFNISPKVFLLLFFALVLHCFPLSAQSDLGLRFNQNLLSQNNLYNPAAFQNFDVTLALPSSYVGYSNPTFALDEVIRYENKTFKLNAEDLLEIVDPNGLTFHAKAAAESFALNLQNEKFLFHLHHGVKVYNTTQIPNDLFQLIGYGNTPFLDETINIGIQQSLLAYQELGFGFGLKANDQLSIGARIKVLKGIAHMETPKSSASLYTNPDFYQISIASDYELQTAGLEIADINKLEDLGLASLQVGFFSGKNTGFSFDLGATFQLNKKLQLAASVNNIGSINWKNNAYVHQSNGQYDHEGIDLKPLLNEEEISLEEIGDTLTDLFKFETNSTTYKTSTPANAHLSARYEWKERLFLTGFVTGERWNSKIDLAGGIGIRKEIRTWLAVGAQYSFDNQLSHHLGLMTMLRLGPLQWYFTTDNIAPFIDPLKTKHLNVRTGFNLVFGNQGKRARKVMEEELLLKDSLQLENPIVENLEPEEKEDKKALKKEAKKEAKRLKAEAEVAEKARAAAEQEALVKAEAAAEAKAREEALAQDQAKREATITAKQKALAKAKAKQEAETIAAKKAEEEALTQEKARQAAVAAEQKALAKAEEIKETEVAAAEKAREAALAKEKAKEKAALAIEKNKIAEQEALAELDAAKESEVAATKKAREEALAKEKATLEAAATTEIAETAKEEITINEKNLLVPITAKEIEAIRDSIKANRQLPDKKEIETTEAEAKELAAKKQRDEAARQAEAERFKAAQEKERIEAERQRQQAIAAQSAQDRQRRAAEEAQRQQARTYTSLGTYSLTAKTSLREEATSSSVVLKRVALGAKVKVLEKTSKYWWLVELNGKRGYVKAALLKE